MHNGGGHDISELIKNARRAKGLSQSELARRVGAAQQTIEKLETGKVQRSSFLASIALELGIPIDRIARFGHKEAVGAASMGSFAAPNSVVIAGRSLVGEVNDLPVYAIQIGGSGVPVLSQQAVESVSRPAPLARVRDGYGVMTIDDTMSPEIRAGDVALVNPHLPPRVGDTLVFRRRLDEGGEQVIIRQLRKLTERDYCVRAWNDGEAEEANLRRSEWSVVHVVVGTYKRR